MVKKKLVEELINDGANILKELDRRSFPVEAMFWIHLADQDYWRLVIASPLVAAQGGVSTYRKLGEILRALELAGITLEDISLLDPNSQDFVAQVSLVSASGRLAAGAAWLEFEEGVVYRWTGAAVTGELTCGIPLSKINETWQDERRILNLPALLISLDGRRVTLRFHPQHGPLGGIENMKFNFKNAVQRAYPACRIDWL